MILAAAWYHTILAFLFAVLAVIIMLVILLQRGRGVGLSGAFGGAGGTSAFGAKTGDILTWVTIVGAAVLLTYTAALNYVFVESPAPAIESPDQAPAPGLPAPAPGSPGAPAQPLQATPIRMPPPGATPMPAAPGGAAPIQAPAPAPNPTPAAPAPTPTPTAEPPPAPAPTDTPPAPAGSLHFDPAWQPVYVGLAIFGVEEA
jgi:preprotein translocase subunit SecG